MIYIYYAQICEKRHEDLLHFVLPKLPVEFQEKIKRFRRWQDAQVSILGRVLLLEGMREIYRCNTEDLSIKYTAHNKPFFENSLIKFNISHSGEIAVCAFSADLDLGIDIEFLADIQIEDFYSQMTENEMEVIRSSNDAKIAFFDYWTQKEAVLKAYGNGLSVPLQSFEILEKHTNINGQNYFLQEVHIEKNYKCYISQKTPINDFSIKKIKK